MVVVAKALDRLEVLYYENHDTTKVSYAEFLKANMALIAKDLLDEGDRVTVIETQENKPKTTVVQRQKLW